MGYFSFIGTGHYSPSLTRRLLLGLTLVVVVVMTVFLVWDYRVTWNEMLAQKQTALAEEAKILLSAMPYFQEKGTLEEAQSYIDKICGKMQDTDSPGHHIAVKTGEDVIQAHSHFRASPEIWAAMEFGVSTPEGLASVGENSIVVGSAKSGNTRVYVSEYLSSIRKVLHRDIIRRLLSIALVGLVIVLVVNIGVDRFLARPLGRMVESVRRFAAGDRRVRMPRSCPRELGILADEFDNLAEALEHSERERAFRMRKARRVQQNLHPDLSEVEGFTLGILFEPAEEVGGDFYDVITLPDKTTLFCIIDVTDHGVPAALSAGMLKTSLLHALNETSRPDELLQMMNHDFAQVALPEDFATVLLARWDRKAKIITYASAGHEICYLVREKGGEPELVAMSATGLILGFEEEASWRLDSLEAGENDLLLLLTDGVVETRSKGDEQFGRQMVQTLLKTGHTKEPERIIKNFKRALAEHRGNGRQMDDVTILAARRISE